MSGQPREAVEPDADATVVLPTPGRRRSPFVPYLDRPAAAADLSALGGLNPLVEAANPILAAVAQIRHALRHPDPTGLQKRIAEQVQGFERSARAAQLPEAQIEKARFALTALLDDAARATPWGRDWALGEPGAPERFFTLLDELTAAAAAHLDLLEFLYVCLALGFEGKYRGGEGARQALTQIRTRLHEILAQHRPQASAELSARWRGAELRQRRVSGGLAVWGIASACALVLAVLYFSYSVSLGARSDPVARQMAQLKPPPVGSLADKSRPEPVVIAAADLAAALGLPELDVSESGGATVIGLKSDRLFAPGSARLDAALEPVILKVAEALDRVPGTIVVTGHTDDVPIRTARFPSNWELSTERARSVTALMAKRMKDPSRLRAEGLADSEPLAPNDSAAGRARNRRVAILLRKAP